MKNIGTIIMALALVLGLAQCKKQGTPATPDAEGKKVFISMKTNGGDRHIVYPNTGVVEFTDGDIIYVGSSDNSITGDPKDKKWCLGVLTYNDNNHTFSGDIYEPAQGANLWFYYLGGHTIAYQPGGTAYDIYIKDQSSVLPVLSFGISNETYPSSNGTYSCILENKCALVKFECTDAVYDDVILENMPCKVTVDFEDGGIHPSGGEGNITLYSQSGTRDKWAILLPGTELKGEGVNIECKIGNNICTITCDETVPNWVEENYLITEGITINIP